MFSSPKRAKQVLLISIVICIFIGVATIIRWKSPFSLPQKDSPSSATTVERSTQFLVAPVTKATQARVQAEQAARESLSRSNEVSPQQAEKAQEKSPQQPVTDSEQIVTPVPDKQKVTRISENNGQETDLGDVVAYLWTDQGPIPLRDGVPYFNPPEWKIKYLPTRDEVKQLAQLTAEIDDANTSETRRQVLIAQKEAIYQNAHRPTKSISGVIVTKGDEPPPDINFYEEYHRQNPE